MMGNIKDILIKSPVFSSLEKDDIERLGALFDRMEISPGDILTAAKDSAQYFFLLDQGTILLAMEEDRSVVLNSPGDFIGLELLSVKGVYKTTLTVLEKGGLFYIPRQEFLDLIQEDSDAATAIMESWQEYLERTAPFARNIEVINFPYNY